MSKNRLSSLPNSTMLEAGMKAKRKTERDMAKAGSTIKTEVITMDNGRTTACMAMANYIIIRAK